MLSFDSGELNIPYYIASDRYISFRTRRKIDKLTNEMLENGLNEHLESMKTFDLQMNAANFFSMNKDKVYAVLEPISKEQMMRPMILICGLWIAAILVFIGEIIVNKWNIWREKSKETIETRSRQEPKLNSKFIGRSEIARKYLFYRFHLKRPNLRVCTLLRKKNQEQNIYFDAHLQSRGLC